MTDRIFAKYLWLIATIKNAGRISFAEIESKWDRASVNDLRQPLKLRTFHNHRQAILMQFGIDIECDRTTYQYYIANPDALEDNDILKWQLDAFTMNAALQSHQSLSNRIILESVPSASLYLEDILHAMDSNHRLKISYKDFFGMVLSDIIIEPYAMRMFKRRWYVLAHVPSTDEIRRFALDRITSFMELADTFKLPKNFSAKDYYANYFGVAMEETPVTIRIKATREKPSYLRSLPLHHSQKEVETGDGYAIFEYFVSPSFDFVQETLLHGDQVEVLSPMSLRYLTRKRWNVSILLPVRQPRIEMLSGPTSHDTRSVFL